MKCSNCGNELTADMFSSGMCFSCGYSTSDSEKVYEEERMKQQEELLRQKEEQKQYMKKLLADQKAEIETRLNNHMLTTGFYFECYKITKYIGLVSGETVIGTGYFSDISARITDFFGAVSIEYSKKIKQAKALALSDMIKESTEKGGNAIIGISYEIITFNRDMVGVSINGTSVLIENQE